MAFKICITSLMWTESNRPGQIPQGKKLGTAVAAKGQAQLVPKLNLGFRRAEKPPWAGFQDLIGRFFSSVKIAVELAAADST